MTPYFFQSDLSAYNSATEETLLEFTATQHGGILRASFPTYTRDAYNNGYDQTRRISIGLNGDPDTATVSTDYFNTVSISGYSTKSSGGTGDGFKFYFIAAIFSGEEGTGSTTASFKSADSSWAYANFDAKVEANKLLTVRIGTSFISLEQAILNLEVSHVLFDTCCVPLQYCNYYLL